MISLKYLDGFIKFKILLDLIELFMLTAILVDSIFKYYGVGFISLFSVWWGAATSLGR